MPIEVTMPKLSPTMETGVIAQWLVKVGDQVKEGDSLADIETDKATMPMKSYDDGTIVYIDHAAGDEVSLGQRVMVLAKKGEDPQKDRRIAGTGQGSGGGEHSGSQVTGDGAGTSAASHSAGNGQQAPAVEAQPVVGGRLKASPLARKVAASSQVELGQVRGSGPGGRIVRRDVESFLQGEPKARGAAAAEQAGRGCGASGKVGDSTAIGRRSGQPANPAYAHAEDDRPAGCSRPSRPLPRSI